MTGYAGYSKSNNALSAEADGRFPLSIATRMLARATGMKSGEAKALLISLHGGEFHHASKFYNAVNYYDVGQAVAHHGLTTFAASLPAGWRDALSASRAVEISGRSFARRHADIAAADAAYAASIGADAERLVDAFYALRG